MSKSAGSVDHLLIDRCVSLVLAAAEVGPHIKTLRQHTGIPHAIVNNAVWHMRRAGLWYGHGRSSFGVDYPWLFAFKRDEDEGHEGLVQAATIAAGLLRPTSDGLKVNPYARSAQWPRIGSIATCGTSLALATHHIMGEECGVCEEAATQRAIARAERQQRKRAMLREQRTRRIEQDQEADTETIRRYQAFLEREASERDARRQRHARERQALKEAGLQIPYPKLLSLDWQPSHSDRFDEGVGLHERVTKVGPDWDEKLNYLDPTFDAVASLMEQFYDRDHTSRTYQQLVAQAIATPTGPSYIVDGRKLNQRIGVAVHDYPGRMEVGRQWDWYDRQ